MSNKQARGKHQIPQKKCNQNNMKLAANSNKRKQPQKLNSKLGLRVQDDLLPAQYILSKVFRKDGPPLGVEFDDLPSHAFRFCTVKVFEGFSYCIVRVELSAVIDSICIIKLIIDVWFPIRISKTAFSIDYREK
ncbi:hypothetical protein HanLR1_Chr14g0547571 [Helianthus annuus]|nr:hypothetical protein HanLR1_Chr14g0547571 [Helianthus annuus]